MDLCCGVRHNTDEIPEGQVELLSFLKAEADCAGNGSSGGFLSPG